MVSSACRLLARGVLRRLRRLPIVRSLVVSSIVYPQPAVSVSPWSLSASPCVRLIRWQEPSIIRYQVNFYIRIRNVYITYVRNVVTYIALEIPVFELLYTTLMRVSARFLCRRVYTHASYVYITNEKQSYDVFKSDRTRMFERQQTSDRTRTFER